MNNLLKHALCKPLLVSAFMLPTLFAQASNEPILNLRQHPLGLFTGTLILDFDFYLNDAMTVGPSLLYSDESNYINGFDLQLGLRVNYAWNQNIHKNGWLLSNRLFAAQIGDSGIHSFTVTDCLAACGANVTLSDWVYGLEIHQNYQWIVAEFVTITLGIGQTMLVGDRVDSQLGKLNTEFLPSGEFSVGWRL